MPNNNTPIFVSEVVTIKTDLQIASQAGKEKECLQAEGSTEQKALSKRAP